MSLPLQRANNRRAQHTATATANDQQQQQQQQQQQHATTKLPPLASAQGAAASASASASASAAAHAATTAVAAAPQPVPPASRSHRSTHPVARDPPAPAKISVRDMSALASPDLSLEHALLLPDRRSKAQAQMIQARAAASAHATAPVSSLLSSAPPVPASSSRAQSLSRLYPPAADPSAPIAFGGDRRLMSAPPFQPRSLSGSMTSPSPVMSYWMKAMSAERSTDHASDVSIWETQLAEVIALSGSEEITPQRVAFVCDLVDQASAHVGRWAPILRRILRELFHAVYQNYSPSALDAVVPIWTTTAASWIGYTAPRYGNVLDDDSVGGVRHIMHALGSGHPLSALGEANAARAKDKALAAEALANSAFAASLTPGQTGLESFSLADALATPLPPAPPRSHYFRHELWDLNRLSWEDLLAKAAEAQNALAEHRARVARELGMVINQQGNLVAGTAAQARAKQQQQEEESKQQHQHPSHVSEGVVSALKLFVPDSSHSVEPAAEDGADDDVITPLPVPSPSSSPRMPLARASSSASSLQAAGSTGESLSPTTPRGPSLSRPRSLALAPPTPSGRTSRVTSLSLMQEGSGGGPQNLLAVPPTPTNGGGSGSGILLTRPGSSMQMQRQSIIDSAKEAARAESDNSLPPPSPRSSTSRSPSLLAVRSSPRSSPLPAPLTEASMASLDSSAMGSLVSQAMALSSKETGVQFSSSNASNSSYSSNNAATLGSSSNTASHASIALTPHHEESKEELSVAIDTSAVQNIVTLDAGAEATERDAVTVASAADSMRDATTNLFVVGRPSPPEPSFVSSPSSATTTQDNTEAATAQAFHTIHSLISTPPIPRTSLVSYIDVAKRLDMQYENLYVRLRTWAQKQDDLNNQNTSRDVTLNRIAKGMKKSLLWNMFGRWASVVRQRKRQLAAFERLHGRYAHHAGHLAHRFLTWKLNALRQRTHMLDRSVRETDAKNSLLSNEISEQKFALGKEAERRDALRSVEASLSSERDSLRDFLDQCQAQISAVQGAQITALISGAIGMVEKAVGVLWGELKSARASRLQDPCRMMASSTNLMEHVSKSYSSMPEGSPEWIKARASELQRTRHRLGTMLDSDLLLLWCNFHLASAHLAVNQEKLSAKFHGKTYKYDVPGAFPMHVRNFFSSEASLVRRTENFTSSLQDCEVLLRIVNQLSPHLCDTEVLATVDLEARGRRMMRVLHTLAPDAAILLAPMDLTHSFCPDLTAAMLARIMMLHPNLGVDTSAFVDPRKKPRSEYAPAPARRAMNSMELARDQQMSVMRQEVGLSTQGATKAQQLIEESIRIERLGAAESAEAAAMASGLSHAGVDRQDSFLTHRDEQHLIAAAREKRAAGSDGAASAGKLVQELEVEDAERSVPDCGPFTQMLRALHLVKRELTTRARVEVSLVAHVTGSIKKVMADVRCMLDDAYERDLLWQQVRRRMGAFVSTILTHQMRGEPLIMQDRKSIRQIRRYTKLLDRQGKPQARFADLLHPWNRTSNDHFMARKKKVRTAREGHSSDDNSDDESVHSGPRKRRSTKPPHASGSSSKTNSPQKGARKLKVPGGGGGGTGSKRSSATNSISNTANNSEDEDERGKKSGSDDDASHASSSASSSSSSDATDSDDDEGTEAGSRTAAGDDLWKEWKPLSSKALAALSSEDQERELRRLRNRNETQEDLLNQTIFELAKIQEMIAKHYTAIRDIYRAYAQWDASSEMAFRAREEEKNSTGSSGVGGGGSSAGASQGSLKEAAMASITNSIMAHSSHSVHNTEGGSGAAAKHADKSDPTHSLRKKLLETASGSNAASSSFASHGGGHDSNPQLRIHEFWLFVRDCKLLSPSTHFTTKRLQRIFEHVWARDLKASMVASGAVSESTPFETIIKDKARMEIDCRQFVEVLVRIAHQRMPTAKEREEILAEIEMDREADVERKRAEGVAPSSSDLTRGSVVAHGSDLSEQARQMDALTRASISVGQTNSGAGGGLGGAGAGFNPTTGVNGANPTMNPAFEWGTPLFPSTRPGLALRLFGLLRCKLMPSAARLNVDQFRSQYKRIEISTLFKKHGQPLRRIFYRYAKMHAIRGKHHATPAAAVGSDDDDHTLTDAVWTNTIDSKELLQMLRDSKILDGKYLTVQQVYAICANVQVDLAKVAPAHPESKAGGSDKPSAGAAAAIKRRGSLPKKLEVPSSVSEGGTASGTASEKGSRATSRRGSLGGGGGGEWGSGDRGGHHASLSLHDLDLEAQAAQASVAPSDEQILAAQATGHTELIFNEFLEAIAAIAAIKHPNPYKPMHVRLQQFLERDLLPWISLVCATTKE